MLSQSIPGSPSTGGHHGAARRTVCPLATRACVIFITWKVLARLAGMLVGASHASPESFSYPMNWQTQLPGAGEYKKTQLPNRVPSVQLARQNRIGVAADRQATIQLGKRVATHSDELCCPKASLAHRQQMATPVPPGGQYARWRPEPASFSSPGK